MEQKTSVLKIANLSSEQQQKINQVESELGCVLVAYEDKNQKNNNIK